MLHSSYFAAYSVALVVAAVVAVVVVAISEFADELASSSSFDYSSYSAFEHVEMLESEPDWS